MRKRTRRLGILAVGLMSLGVMATAAPAGAGHQDDPRTDNLHPMGHIEEARSLIRPGENPNIHTDLAFWGKFAFQGNWDGFTIRDISAPGNPKTISHTSCDGNQGDIVVWENILVRSWNTPAGTPGPFGAGLTCAGQAVPQGFEGLHVFDISDVTAPVLVGDVELSAQSDPTGCGSHTATGVPDLANDRLLIYNSASSGACPWLDIVEVPLANPGDAALVRQVPTLRECHDTGVILGDAMLAGCAGGNGYTVLTLDPANLDDPQFLLSKNVNDEPEIDNVTIGHSAAFSWDGEILIFGHEPGGGVGARCTEDDPDSDKSAMFFDSRTGEFLGMWTIPRPQTVEENCTFHNFNVVPLRSGKNVLVHGSYQSGTSVVDFTDPANAVELAWSDPPPLPLVPEIEIAPGTFIPNPFCDGVGCDIGGAWSSYWYNNFIYETNITEGLNIFRFSGNESAGALRLGHLNPQTQEFTIP